MPSETLELLPLPRRLFSPPVESGTEKSDNRGPVDRLSPDIAFERLHNIYFLGSLLPEVINA